MRRVSPGAVRRPASRRRRPLHAASPARRLTLSTVSTLLEILAGGSSTIGTPAVPQHLVSTFLETLAQSDGFGFIARLLMFQPFSRFNFLLNFFGCALLFFPLQPFLRFWIIGFTGDPTNYTSVMFQPFLRFWLRLRLHASQAGLGDLVSILLKILVHIDRPGQSSGCLEQGFNPS